MTFDDIDHLFDIMATEAAEIGDDGLLPGAVMLSADNWCRMPSGRARCTNILHGIRFRGVRVNVSSAYQDQVLNRTEAGDRGEPYVDGQGRPFLTLDAKG